MLGKDGLFIKETQMLEHTHQILAIMDTGDSFLQKEYELLSKNYSKLLKLSKKLVSMADNTHRKLKNSNDLVHEKIMQLTAAEEELKKLAITDTLTGLLNRRGVWQWLEEEEIRFFRKSCPFTLFIIDIDFFKAVNDSHGHHAGDYILKVLAESMKTSIRAQDCLSRWGGEEFLLVFPDTDITGGLVIAEKMRNKIEKLVIEYKEVTVKITISLGGCGYSRKMGLNSCLEMADKALYKSKTDGRNRVNIYEY